MPRTPLANAMARRKILNPPPPPRNEILDTPLIKNMEHIMDLLEEKRKELLPYEIDACINQFRHRLRRVIKVAGKHIIIEQFF